MSNRQNPESTRDTLAQMLDLLGMEARVVVEEEDQETVIQEIDLEINQLATHQETLLAEDNITVV